ncbi:MAG: T9SS type A sorting domain-containing protein [Ignavibacteria bacterium]|nr:T9SS type A sorting domain-containing protein [Ignavibacteria bacterium]
MKKSILFLLLVSFSPSFSQVEQKISPLLQQKLSIATEDEQLLVWIFFTDKGIATERYFANPIAVVSEKSLQRRAKVFPVSSLIDYSDLPVNEHYISPLLELGFRLKHTSKWFNGISGYVQKSSLEQFAQFSFVQNIDVVYTLKKKYNVEDNATQIIPSDHLQKNEHTYNYGSSFTQLNQINVPPVHDLGITGQGIVICVMDAGFNNLPHEVFANMNIIAKWDFVNNDPDVGDGNDMGSGSHGTQTLSTIGGFKEGKLLGPAFSATYILAKTENTDSETPIEEDNWIAAAEWADSIGVDVTSTSLGYITFDAPYPSYTWQSMNGNTCRITIGADMAAAKGIVVVNSAGNEGDDANHNTLGAPSDGDSVIAVGAVGSSGSRSSFSSVGPTVDGRIKPDVMAMGSSVAVASPSNVSGYTTSSGTSFSCPLAAGVAALILSANPVLTPMQVREAMRNTASRYNNPDKYYGWGILDAYDALNYFRIQIAHIPLADTENPNREHKISATFSSHFPLSESQYVFYSVNSAPHFDSVLMIPTGNTNSFEAVIPISENNVTIRYFIRASLATPVYTYLPFNAPEGYFQFFVGEDTMPPVISHRRLGNQSLLTWPPVITANITDNIGVKNVSVQWKHNGVQQEEFLLVRFNNTIEFQLEIPLADSLVSVGDIFSYRIIATDSATQTNTTFYPNASTEISFTVVNFANYTTTFDLTNGELTSTNDWQWGTPQPLPSPHSSPKVWGTILNGNYSTGPLLSTLNTPSLYVTDANATFSFWHWYIIENRYDGGNVKISVNGNPFVLITPLENYDDGGNVKISVNGNPFVLITPLENYDTTLSTQYQNPIGGERAFSGNSGTWKVATFHLNGIVNVGDNVIFSFQFGVDTYVEYSGWYIDDIVCNGLGWIPVSVLQSQMEIPQTISLLQNYPNPFNPTTTIRFEIPVGAIHELPLQTTLKIYNILGREVATLLNNEEMDAGKHEIQFDGSKFASGVYFYRLSVIQRGKLYSIETKKMILLK